MWIRASHFSLGLLGLSAPLLPLFFPLCFLLSLNTCHHPFYLSDDFVSCAPTASCTTRSGLSRPRFRTPAPQPPLRLLCSVISGNPPATSGLLPKMGEGGGCHSQPRRGPTPWARVRVPFLFPATRCHAPSPLLAPRAPSPPSAPSSEAPKPPADTLVKVPGPPQPAGHGARRQGPLPRQRAPAARS